MLKEYRRRRQLAEVRPGDGSPLKEYRLWQLFTRSLFVLEVPRPDGGHEDFEVDVHHVAEDGTEQVLRPHPRSLEGLRARSARRYPRASALVGAVSVAVLLVGLALTPVTVVGQVSRIPPIAAALGTFTAPIQLSGWPTVAVTVAATLAAVERATALRSWLLRSGAWPPCSRTLTYRSVRQVTGT